MADALSGNATQGSDDAIETTDRNRAVALLLRSVAGAVIGLVVAATQGVIADHENAAAAFLSTHSFRRYVRLMGSIV